MKKTHLKTLGCGLALACTTTGFAQTDSKTSNGSQVPSSTPSASGGPESQTQLGNAPQNRRGDAGQGTAQIRTTPGQRGSQEQMSNYSRFRQRPWFDNSDVRRQLGIDDNQYGVLNRSYGSAYNRYRDRMAEIRNLDAAQRRERLRNLERDFDRDYSPALDSVFTDPQRRSRYNQLSYQYRGYDAFNDPSVRQQLNLTPEQRQNLSGFTRARNREMQRLERTYGTNPDLAGQQYRELQDQYWNQLGSTLDEQQLRTWNSMIGDRYDFSAEAYWNQPERRADRQSESGRQDETETSSTQPRNATPSQRRPD